MKYGSFANGRSAKTAKLSRARTHTSSRSQGTPTLYHSHTSSGNPTALHPREYVDRKRIIQMYRK